MTYVSSIIAVRFIPAGIVEHANESDGTCLILLYWIRDGLFGEIPVAYGLLMNCVTSIRHISIPAAVKVTLSQGSALRVEARPFGSYRCLLRNLASHRSLGCS